MDMTRFVILIGVKEESMGADAKYGWHGNLAGLARSGVSIPPARFAMAGQAALLRIASVSSNSPAARNRSAAPGNSSVMRSLAWPSSL